MKYRITIDVSTDDDAMTNTNTVYQLLTKAIQYAANILDTDRLPHESPLIDPNGNTVGAVHVKQVRGK